MSMYLISLMICESRLYYDISNTILRPYLLECTVYRVASGKINAFIAVAVYYALNVCYELMVRKNCKSWNNSDLV